MNRRSVVLTSRSLLIVFALAVFIYGCGSSKPAANDTSFIAPGYEKKSYKKILVLTLVEQPIYQKKIEDALVVELKDRGYPVSAANINVPGDLRKDTANLRKKVEGEGYDGALVLTYLGETTVVQDQAHYNGNVYSVFYGAYPTYDLETKAIKSAVFQCDFYVHGKTGTQWRAPVRVKRGTDINVAIEELSRLVRQKIVADKII